MDGSSTYMTVGFLFIVQAIHAHLGFGRELLVLGVMLLTSKGARGRPGRRLHRADGHPRGIPRRPGQGERGAAAGGDPLHVHGGRRDEHGREWRGHSSSSTNGRGTFDPRPGPTGALAGEDPFVDFGD